LYKCHFSYTQTDKVKVDNLSGGYPHHQEVAKKHLSIGNIYTIEETEVDNWHTDVYLKEFPGIAFNSVFFEDAE
jgi:hypothetical protein